MAATMRALADCPECGGEGATSACGRRCERCRGEGLVVVAVDEDVFFSDLPPGMSRDDAKALLRRIRENVAANARIS